MLVYQDPHVDEQPLVQTIRRSQKFLRANRQVADLDAEMRAVHLGVWHLDQLEFRLPGFEDRISRQRKKLMAYYDELNKLALAQDDRRLQSAARNVRVMR